MPKQTIYDDFAYLIALVAVCAITIGSIYGWVENIVKLLHLTITPVTGEVILRIAGIFVPPLGAVMGYL